MPDAKPLTALREGCQRGEMPTVRQWHAFLVGQDLLDFRRPHWRRYSYERDLYFDALHALQQALWPGSRLDIVSKRDTDGWRYLAGIWSPTGGLGENVVGAGKPCPTLVTAWLNAILAGLQEKDDG